MQCLWRSSALLRGATLGSHFPFYSPSTDSWGLVFLGPRLWQLWIIFLSILLHPTRGGDPGVTFLRILSLLLHFFTVTKQKAVGSHTPSPKRRGVLGLTIPIRAGTSLGLQSRSTLEVMCEFRIACTSSTCSYNMLQTYSSCLYYLLGGMQRQTT